MHSLSIMSLTYNVHARNRYIFPLLPKFQLRWTSSNPSLPAKNSQRVKVRNLDIYTIRCGTGEKQLLCLPGALGSSNMDYGPLMSKFPFSRMTVTAWDPPGYGKSRPPERDFSLGVEYYYRDADLAFELMMKLGHSRFSILGWSDGAKTGAVLAAKYPDHVIKFVSIGNNSYVTEEDIACYKSVLDISKWSKYMRDPMIATYGEQKFQQMWIDWVKMLENIHKSGGHIYTKELNKIRCPTLIVHGMLDAMVPYHHAQFLHKHIRNSWLHIFPDGKHNPHIRYPDEFIALLDKFLFQWRD